jgi:enoyl-[acyl-carrier protein] reductase I
MNLLEGKTGLIMGVGNKRSIAWGIANAANAAGARIVLSYQNERFGENVRELAPQLNNPLLLPCDVASDEQIEALMARIGEEVGHLDFLVHALAFAPREALDGMYADTKREDFHIALDISAYSLVAVSRAALPLLKDRQAGIITLTYLGSERVVQNYNVMGVAKAALEASVRYRPVRNPGECDFRRPHQDTRFRGHRRDLQYDQAPRGTRAPAQAGRGQ